MYVVAHIGSEVLRLVGHAGRAGLLFGRILRSLRAIPRSLRLIFQQMFVIGNGSIPLVLFTSVFTGAVATVQAAYQFRSYVPMRFLGTVVAKSVVIELGPVLTALVVGARVGASIAAELGTMRVTEQIDALEMMAIDPVRYLAMPRFVAACIMLPMLTVFADVIAILGGWVVAMGTLDVTTKTFTDGLRTFFEVKDVYGGLIKAFVFGGIIAISGTVHGFSASGGAEGVGAAAMRAVVTSSVLILVADYILTTVIFQVLFSVMATSGQHGVQRIPYGDGSGIVIRGLHKAFGTNAVLDGVDLDIPRGDARVVLGRSGQGKSVLLKLIVGLLKPDAGSIRVDGEEVTAVSRRELFGLRRRFGMVFQGGALFDSMTVLENVALGLREHTRLADAEVRDRALEALAMVGLAEVGDKPPSELSGGMKKRASLARAIVMQPDYILYDEPTTGLDPITSDAINRMIQKLDRELGVTSIVVTHDMASAFMVGDRFALLNRGKIVFDGSAAEAREAAGGPIRQFIDGSAEGPLEAF